MLISLTWTDVKANGAPRQARFSKYFQRQLKVLREFTLKRWLGVKSAPDELFSRRLSDARASSRSERNIVVHVAAAGAGCDGTARRGAGRTARPEIAA